MKQQLVIMFFVSLISTKSTGQTSMMPEVSYTMLDKLIQLAKENYPRMKVFEQQIFIAKLGIQKARSSWLDVVSLAYMRTDNLGSTNKNTYLLNGYQYGLNLNLGLMAQKPGQVKAAKNALEIAMQEKNEYNLAIEQTVKERYIVYVKQLTILKLRMKAAQDAESVLKLVNSKFEKGETTFENYNSVLNLYTDQVQERMNTEAALLIARTNLEEIIGTRLEDMEYWQADSVKQ